MPRSQSQPTRTRRLAGQRDTAAAAVACEECGGVECGTARVPVCCEACTH